MTAPSPWIVHSDPPGFLRGARHRGDRLRRFRTPPPHADRDALSVPRQAAEEGRTAFPATVIPAAEAPRILVSGRHQAKIGIRIEKGPWAGLPIYCLTLEERATCPRSCHEWATCYGNGMHLSRRLAPGPDLEYLLGAELAMLADRHRRGFAVRLHVLGDFYSVRYTARWAVWLRWIPGLHLFGFTAHPDGSPIARLVERMNGRFPDRCAIRFSRAAPSGQGWEAVTIWRAEEGPWVPEGLICPAQLGRTATCGTCGLCWSPAAGATTIVFLGHGRRRPFHAKAAEEAEA